MEKKKKIWTEPKLTALVRRKPEEGILLSCKGVDLYGTNTTASGCAKNAGCNGVCDELAST